MSNLEKQLCFLCACIAKELQVPMLDTEQIEYVTSTYEKLNKSKYVGMSFKQVATILSKAFADRIKSQDLAKYMAAAIKLEPDTKQEYAVDYNPEGQIQIASYKPAHKLVHYYLALDSDYRDTSQETYPVKQFTWQYAPTQNRRVGFCNSVGTIRNIVSMKLYQPRIPYSSLMMTSAKRVSISIDEFKAQAYIANSGHRFHFILRPNFEIGQTSIDLTAEDQNDCVFNFREPITYLDSITLKFGNPSEVISYEAGFPRFMIALEFTCIIE